MPDGGRGGGAPARPTGRRLATAPDRWARHLLAAALLVHDGVHPTRKHAWIATTHT
jgi:hypothetical protein